MTDLRMIRPAVSPGAAPLHVEGRRLAAATDTVTRLRRAGCGTDEPADWSLARMFRGLAAERRWQGRATDIAGRRLSVAHHSLWCAVVAWMLCEDRPREMRAGSALWALLHDGHEAWTGDIERPQQLRRPGLLRRQASLDEMILERIAAIHPGLAAWARQRLWDAALVEMIDRTASSVEREFYVLGDARRSPASLPTGWPALPGRLESEGRAAAAMQARFDDLAAQLEMVFAFGE